MRGVLAHGHAVHKCACVATRVFKHTCAGRLRRRNYELEKQRERASVATSQLQTRVQEIEEESRMKELEIFELSASRVIAVAATAAAAAPAAFAYRRLAASRLSTPLSSGCTLCLTWRFAVPFCREEGWRGAEEAQAAAGTLRARCLAWRARWLSSA
jgi:hypothetical protein